MHRLAVASLGFELRGSGGAKVGADGARIPAVKPVPRLSGQVSCITTVV